MNKSISNSSILITSGKTGIFGKGTLKYLKNSEFNQNDLNSNQFFTFEN